MVDGKENPKVELDDDQAGKAVLILPFAVMVGAKPDAQYVALFIGKCANG
jgi:hypothetical protein